MFWHGSWLWVVVIVGVSLLISLCGMWLVVVGGGSWPALGSWYGLGMGVIVGVGLSIGVGVGVSVGVVVYESGSWRGCG